MHAIDTNELKRMLDQHEDFVLINVLDAESFEEEHIPGSHNVPSQDLGLNRKVEELAGRKDRRIVLYCANVECHASAHAGERLEHGGFTNVMHYPGGIEGWKAAGHDIEQGAGAPTM